MTAPVPERPVAPASLSDHRIEAPTPVEPPGWRSNPLVLIGVSLGLKAVDVAKGLAVAAVLGLSAGGDVYAVATALPMMLLMASGLDSLRGVAAAEFTSLRAKGAVAEAWRLCWAYLLLTAVVCLAVAGAVGWFAPTIIDLLVPGLDAAHRGQLTLLLRWLLPLLTLVGAANFAAVVLNGLRRFIVPLVALNLISWTTLLAVWWLGSGAGLGWLVGAFGAGQVLGSVLILTTLVSRQRRDGVGMPALGSLVGAIQPALLLSIDGWVLRVAAAQIAASVDRNVASGLNPGTIAALTYATTVVGLMLALVTTNAYNLLWPTLSRRWATGDRSGAANGVWTALRLLGALLLPLVAILVALRIPTVQVLYQRGVFTRTDVAMTATPLVWLGGWICLISVSQLLSALFLVARRQRVFGVTSAVGYACHIGLSIGLSRRYGYLGIAMGQTLGMAVQVALQFGAARGLLSAPGRDWWRQMGWVVLAALAAGATAVGLSNGLGLDGQAAPSLGLLIRLGATAGLAGLVAVALLAVGRIPELTAALSGLRRRVAGG